MTSSSRTVRIGNIGHTPDPLLSAHASVTTIAAWEAAGRAPSEYSRNIRPEATTAQTHCLIAPAMLGVIEGEAIVAS